MVDAMIDHDGLSRGKLHILHVLCASQGDPFRHVRDLTHEQAARGHAVGLVVGSLPSDDEVETELAKLAPVLELGIKRLPMPRRPHPQDLAGILKVHAHARKLDCHVVHGHGSKGGLYARAPGLWHRRSGMVRCYTPHDGSSSNHVATPIVQAVGTGVERLLARVTDVVLFDSVYGANRFHERIGDTRALVRIVPNGIGAKELERVTPCPTAADLVCVGALRASEGIDTLIDALALLTRKIGRPSRLTLVGSGPDQAAIEAQARLRGIADLVSFVGAHPARQAFTLGRVLVVPSRTKALPYLVLDAAGAQIPMVATDVGGIGELFGPHRDRLVRPDQPMLLAAAMQEAIEAEPRVLRQQAEELAAFVATRFSVSTMSDSVVAGYRDALARRALSGRAEPHAHVVPS